RTGHERAEADTLLQEGKKSPERLNRIGLPAGGELKLTQSLRLKVRDAVFMDKRFRELRAAPTALGLGQYNDALGANLSVIGLPQTFVDGVADRLPVWVGLPPLTEDAGELRF